MKKLFLSLFCLMCLIRTSYAETISLPGYGMYEHPDEINAKNELINSGVNNIYDFGVDPNKDGESIGNGHYYVPVTYNGRKDTGPDTDYIKVDELKGKDGVNGLNADPIENRQEGIIEARILDTRKTTWSVYGGYDFGNDVNIVGGKVVVKLNRSYYEKKVDMLEEQLTLMQVRETRISRTEIMDEKMNEVYSEQNYNITPTGDGVQINSKF